MAPIALTTLVRRRNELKQRVTSFLQWLESVRETPDLDEVEVKTDSLKKHIEALPDIHDKIMERISDEESPAHLEEVNNIESGFERGLALARKLLRKAAEAERASTSGSTPFQKLDHTETAKVNLPTFDGSIEDWAEFKDKFETMIHYNEPVATVHKLQYLLANVTGKAKRAVASMGGSERNYEEAWSLLKNKYDNPRKNILRHIVLLNSTPSLHRDTPEALEDLVDTIRQHLSALKNLGEPVDTWDSWIIHLISCKISAQTFHQ
ncbi:uncharacterized protein LOC135169381 [Diachasmimorpha longicaudata]|uniref:uncharacterized protein LOC135169381 n=1 Tax=Diachasmimorpha longicaudata TaxID=58733 RepID=UPI0030B89AF5